MVDNLSDWRLASTLNVFEIALLLKGYHPADYADDDNGNWPDIVRRETYALIHAIQREVSAKRIKAEISGFDFDVGIDWRKTVIFVESIDEWLSSRGRPMLSTMLSGAAETKAITDRGNPFFAPKLAAAVRAWEYVSRHPETLNNKRPKTAIQDWLKSNASELGLVKPDGALNRTAIDEIAAVANWDQAGGAPATGIANGTTPRLSPNPHEIRKNHPEDSRQSQGNSTTWDDDIPF